MTITRTFTNTTCDSISMLIVSSCLLRNDCCTIAPMSSLLRYRTYPLSSSANPDKVGGSDHALHNQVRRRDFVTSVPHFGGVSYLISYSEIVLRQRDRHVTRTAAFHSAIIAQMTTSSTTATSATTESPKLIKKAALGDVKTSGLPNQTHFGCR